VWLVQCHKDGPTGWWPSINWFCSVAQVAPSWRIQRDLLDLILSSTHSLIAQRKRRVIGNPHSKKKSDSKSLQNIVDHTKNTTSRREICISYPLLQVLLSWLVNSSNASQCILQVGGNDSSSARRNLDHRRLDTGGIACSEATLLRNRYARILLANQDCFSASLHHCQWIFRIGKRYSPGLARGIPPQPLVHSVLFFQGFFDMGKWYILYPVYKQNSFMLSITWWSPSSGKCPPPNTEGLH
jgi:hypothetical protein